MNKNYEAGSDQGSESEDFNTPGAQPVQHPKRSVDFHGWSYPSAARRALALSTDLILVLLIASTITGFFVIYLNELFAVEKLAIGIDTVRNFKIKNILTSSLGTLSLVFTISTLITTLIYSTIAESSLLSATFGKFLFGIKVCTVEKLPLILRESIARNLFKHLPLTLSAGVIILGPVFHTSSELLAGTYYVLACILIAVAFLFLLLDTGNIFTSKHNQALHDNWSFTLTVANPKKRMWLSMLLYICFLTLSLLATTQIYSYFFKNTLYKAYTTVCGESKLSQQKKEASEKKSSFLNLDIFKKDSTFKNKVKALIQSKTAEKESEKIEESNAINEDSFEEEIITEKSGQTRIITTQKKVIPQSHIPEAIRGAVSLNGKSFRITSAKAALSDNGQIVVLNLYDIPTTGGSSDIKSLLADNRAVVRFKIAFNSLSESCSDASLKGYVVDINAKKAGRKSKNTYVSFRRSSNQIISQEYLHFKCLRRKGGYIHAELRGETAFLTNGVRIPILWQIDLTRRLS